MDNIEKRLKETLSSVFEISIDKIDENSTPHTIEKWDSLNHMKMIVALEEEFCVKMDQSEIESMINYNIIKATIFAYID